MTARGWMVDPGWEERMGLGSRGKLVGGVVLRAANQESMIAGGNHTLIPMTPPYRIRIWGTY